MAAWFPKVVRLIKKQNVYPVTYIIQNYNYSSQPRIIKNPTTASLKRGTGGRSSFNGIVCTVFGCNGFIGSNLCIRLGKIGTQLILPHRCDPYYVKELKVGGDLGQVYFQPFDLKDEKSIIKTIKYSNVVINLIGSKYETSNYSFEDVHVEGARRLAKLAKQCNVERFIQMSCLNVNKTPKPLLLKKGSRILKTKWEGELAVKEEFPEATIIRPSVVYGQGDSFINHYMHKERTVLNLHLPLWKKGEETEKWPVYISDVVSGIVAIVRNPDTAGKTYQFIGPKGHKLKELVTMMLHMKNEAYEFPFEIIDLTSGWKGLYSMLKVNLREPFYSIHPTLDLLYESLEFHHTSDNIDPSLPTLEDLGITPIEFEKLLEWNLSPHMDNVKLKKFQEVIPFNTQSILK
ncbi:NADH dehydrogenase [ubiquinone] 1 alpha subcomplex subunit 9, mitochondrial [Eufriesea mexicana]|uniref:NADH dehydrogenase [ubiquinone] 1 alpha subcomplex subunit 9, mitochondrial n=2 Tax=Eufriesea mexicana TaxID=516756 RepID=A0A310SF28_9HYME|nr:NADH dehydrogenase [ubiquinone] 1 alpha subcomplex subunit 9, mitochondrial [Eufriesea mexicana]